MRISNVSLVYKMFTCINVCYVLGLLYTVWVNALETATVQTMRSNNVDLVCKICIEWINKCESRETNIIYHVDLVVWIQFIGMVYKNYLHVFGFIGVLCIRNLQYDLNDIIQLVVEFLIHVQQ